MIHNSTGYSIEYLKQYIKENPKKYLSKSELISEAVIKAINERVFIKGDLLPTVNMAMQEFRVARNTVVRSYEILRKKGIINSRERLGYQIISDNIKYKMRVLMLIQSPNPYMELFYNSVVGSLGDNAQVDVYFHHYNPQVFRSVLRDNAGSYHKYIITSFNNKTIQKEIKKIPVKDLIVCSRNEWMPVKAVTFVQDFYSGTIEALKQALPAIERYNSFCLIFPSTKGHSNQIIKGFNTFCDSVSLPHQIFESAGVTDIMKGHAYLVIEDSDMVNILEAAERRGYIPGRHIGLLSFNDTPIKRVIRDGVSVISTDFKRLGQLAAQAVSGETSESEVLPINYIKRKSL